MRKIILGVVAAAAIATPLVMAAAPANAYTPTYWTTGVQQGQVVNGTTIESIDMNVQLDGSTFYHEYDLTYTPGTDGVITFSGVGKQFDNGGETITGTIDTINQTVTWVSQYLLMNGSIETGNTWGITNAPYVVGANGDLDYTGVAYQRGTGYAVSGGFRNLPVVTTTPVAGNHGQYVSGAVKAGLKGQALKDIAKDVSLVGPYNG